MRKLKKEKIGEKIPTCKELVILQPNEEIKSIQGYEELYSITSFGRVWSHERNVKCRDTYRLVRGKFLNFIKDKKGYLHVNLYKNNKKKNNRIHRLVASHFIENSLNLPEVNHKDTNKQNNRKDNLEWCVDQDNQNHATVEGLRNKEYSQYYGVTFHKTLNCKNKPWVVRIRINKKKEYVGSFKTELEAAKAYNNFVRKHNLNRPLNNFKSVNNA